MIITRVGLLESAVEQCDSLGEGFGEVVKFSSEVNVLIKYTSNRSEHLHLINTPNKITTYHILILKKPYL